MQKLFRMTPLQDSFACNFNILIAGMPRVMGIGEILEEWTAWRTDCVMRRLYFQIQKKEDRLHLLKGLERILLDIDKAIRIIRETELESEVIPNLMIGFGIDEIQANYVAEIKLRNINKEYILKQTRAIDELEKEIADLRDTLGSSRKLKNVIIKELQQVSEKYGQPRKTQIVYETQTVQIDEEEEQVPDYPVTLFLSREGYFKKITPQSLRMSSEQKLKEGDEIVTAMESSNNIDLLFFTDKAQVYKAKASDFADTKASVLGDYIPAKLSMDEGEQAVAMVVTKNYEGMLIFAFENGKVAKVPLNSYATKTNRKRLTGAYSDKSSLVGVEFTLEDKEYLLQSSAGRMLLLHTGAVNLKTSRTTQGVAVMKLKKGQRLMSVTPYAEGTFSKPSRYRTRSLPALGALPSAEDSAEQLTII